MSPKTVGGMSDEGQGQGLENFKAGQDPLGECRVLLRGEGTRVGHQEGGPAHEEGLPCKRSGCLSPPYAGDIPIHESPSGDSWVGTESS